MPKWISQSHNEDSSSSLLCLSPPSAARSDKLHTLFMRLPLQPREPKIGEGDVADKDVADRIDNRAEAQTGDAL
ncbi:hypothetical protein ABG768_025118 [Culter alburnus]|uniref:Uncharacterized protein n=1 Tax=Culter alburnus TaxID=194366 RepID=A0AAW2AGU3_CULAL